MGNTRHSGLVGVEYGLRIWVPSKFPVLLLLVQGPSGSVSVTGVPPNGAHVFSVLFICPGLDTKTPSFPDLCLDYTSMSTEWLLALVIAIW